MGESWRDVHVPVLLEKVLRSLLVRPGGLYVDGTLGLGGHSEAILQASSPSGRVIGFEWDPQAQVLAAARLASFGDRFVLVPASYAELARRVAAMSERKADGLLLDLGVSSLQLDRPERGFSFRYQGPLDMRMNSEIKKTAADLVNNLKAEDLADIFFHYGEERQARRIAARIVEERQADPIATTLQLADLVSKAVPRKYHPQKIHVATRVFQALRIAVNHELDNLARTLEDAPAVLAQGARVCVISFHSLEDRIVKRLFLDHPAYRVISRRPDIAEPEENALNPRARSARLRLAEVV